jgi:hypothetical protein
MTTSSNRSGRLRPFPSDPVHTGLHKIINKAGDTLDLSAEAF